MFFAQGVNSKPKRILVSNGNSELDYHYIMVYILVSATVRFQCLQGHMFERL